MGGGGSYYDRDVTSSTRRISGSGFTDFAAQTVSRKNFSNDVLPKNRRLSSKNKSPLVLPFDDTGSMGDLPLIYVDKFPMIAGQLAENKYLDDVMVSLAFVGDVYSDKAPLQVCDFAKIRDLDPWLEKLWVERNGGGQHFESYEFMAYYYARLYDMEDAQTPILIFTGDEGFRNNLNSADLEKLFGGSHQDVDAKEIFKELKRKFKGHVYLIHRFYAGYDLDNEIVAQWEEVLGKENVIFLKTDLAIADVTLGVIALASGSRTLNQYIEDIKKRPLKMGDQEYKPQSEERLAEVRESLKRLDAFLAKNKGKKPAGGKNAGKNKPGPHAQAGKDVKKDNGKKKDFELF